MVEAMRIGLMDPEGVLSAWECPFQSGPVTPEDDLRAFSLLIVVEQEKRLIEIKVKHPNIPLFYISQAFPVLQTLDEWLPQPLNLALLTHKVTLYLVTQASAPPVNLVHGWCAESHFVALLSACRLGILGSDAQGRIVWCNCAAEGLLGRSDALGCAVEDVLPEPQRAPTQHFKCVSLKLQIPLYAIFELVFFEDTLGLDTLKKEMECFKGYLKLRAQEHVDNLSRDKAKIEAANKIKAGFLAQMSHELRTPMHAILSMAKLGGKKIGRVDHGRLVRYFDTIQRGGEQLLRLLSNLLDLSQLSSGKMLYHFSVGSLQSVLLGVAQDLQALLLERQIQLRVIPPECDDHIRMDQEKIAQVMRNLVYNAIKFSPDQTVIVVDFAQQAESVVLRVMDEGIGIPNNELDYVFEKFAQSSHTKLDNMGTGLGLAICREMVEAHGGHIKAQNRPAQGTCFSVSLPRCEPL